MRVNSISMRSGDGELAIGVGLRLTSTVKFMPPTRPSSRQPSSEPCSTISRIKTLAPFGIKGVGFTDGLDEQKIRSAAEHARADGRIAMIFIETPSNPMNSLVEALCL
jgi:hypothetical protein